MSVQRVLMTHRRTTWIAVALVCLFPFAADAKAQASNDGRLTLKGFSVIPPGGKGWQRVIYKPSSKFPIGYAKFVVKDRTNPHTAAVQVEVSFDRRLRYHDETVLFDGLRKNLIRVTNSDPGMTVHSLETELVTYKANRCMRFIMVVNSSRGFTIHVRGYKCPHPFIPPQILEISYSQRSRSGAWNADLDGEAQVFLDGVEFTPTVMGPYVGELLRNFIQLLRQRRNSVAANLVEGDMNRYDRFLKRKDMAGAFGVDFTDHLKGYANMLEEHGRPGHVTEVRLIAKTFQTNQTGNLRLHNKSTGRPR